MASCMGRQEQKRPRKPPACFACVVRVGRTCLSTCCKREPSRARHLGHEIKATNLDQQHACARGQTPEDLCSHPHTKEATKPSMKTVDPGHHASRLSLALRSAGPKWPRCPSEALRYGPAFERDVNVHARLVSLLEACQPLTLSAAAPAFLSSHIAIGRSS